MGSAAIADFELETFCSRGFNIFVWARRPSNLSKFIVILLNVFMMQTSGQ